MQVIQRSAVFNAPITLYSKFIYILFIATFVVSNVSLAQTESGFLNLPQNALPGTLLSHPDDNDSFNTGRTTTLNYLNGWLIVGAESPGSASGSDKQTRVYDLTDPSMPIRLFPSDFGRNYSSWHRGNTGYNAHAQAMVGNSLWPEGIYVNSWRGPIENDEDGNPRPWHDLQASGFNRSSLMSPWYASMTWYGGGQGEFVISKKFREGNDYELRELARYNHTGRFGGKGWHPIFFGDLLIYARSAQGSGNGVVVYRLNYNNFENPAQASVDLELVASSSEALFGYWPNLYGNNRDKLYMFGTQRNHIQVMDLTAAVDPSVDGNDIVTIRQDNDFPGWPNTISNATYPAYQDQYSFVHRYKFDMDKFIAGEPASEYRVLELNEREHNVDTSQMSLPLGNLWITGGKGTSSGQTRNGPGRQGMAIWVQDSEPDRQAPRVGYHIPQAGRVNYPRWAPLSFIINETPYARAPEVGREFTVRKVNEDGSLSDSITGFTIRSFSSEITFTPHEPLDENATYEVEWISDPASGRGFRDAGGNYIEPYSFRFSTGGSIDDQIPGSIAPRIVDFTPNEYQIEPGERAYFDVNAIGSDLEYRFRINGNWSAWSTASSYSYEFIEAGRYTVALEVRNEIGTAADTLQLIAIGDVNEIAPTRSTTLTSASISGEQVVWSVNPDNDSVMVVNALSGELMDEYTTCKHPRNLATDNRENIWVTCQDSDEVALYSADGSQIHSIDTGYGSAPFGIARSPDGSFMYVTLYSAGKVLRISTNDYTIDEASSFPTPRAIAVDSSGQRVFITRFISDSSHAEVAEFTSNERGFSLARTIPLSPANLIDDPLQASGTPNYLAGIAISPQNDYAVITSKQDNTLRGHAFGRDDFTHDTRIRPIYSVIDLNSNKELFEARRDFDNHEGVYDVAFSPRGDLLFFTLQGSNTVVVSDAIQLKQASGHNVDEIINELTGLAPQGILIDNVSKSVFTQNFTERSVTKFDASQLLEQNSTSIQKVTSATAGITETLSSEELTGLQVFYNAADPRMSAEGYISCASCHIEGGHDGRVWDVTGMGEGFRRTIDLRGKGGLAHGNVHWSGNFDEIQDFEHDIRDAFGGTGFISISQEAFSNQHATPASFKTGLSTELDALAAYVATFTKDSIPRSPWRKSDGALTDTASAGKALFESLNCASCHSGDNFTDSVITSVYAPSLQDVGTTTSFSGLRLGEDALSGVDTPSLLGLHASRLYLHHGQVNDFADAMTFGGGEFIDVQEASGALAFGKQNGGGGDARGMLNDTYMTLEPNAPVTWWTAIGSEVDGEAAKVAIRYAAAQQTQVVLRVNDAEHTVLLKNTINSPNDAPNSWQWAVIDTALNSGENNTIEIMMQGNQKVWLDGIMVSNGSVLRRTEPHSVFASLDGDEKDAIRAFVLSLDGSSDELSGDQSDNSGPSDPTPIEEPIDKPTPLELDASFSLYDASTGELVSILTEGMEIDNTFAEIPLTFKVTPNLDIGSVEITVNGLPSRTENGAPYFAFGDRGSDITDRGVVLGSGVHIVKASFYSQRNLGGELLGELVRSIRIEDEVIVQPEPSPIEGFNPSDVAFTLFDANDASIIAELASGQVIDNTYAEIPVTIRVTPKTPIGSVELTVNGLPSRIENGAPYFMFGDRGGDILDRGLVLGTGTHTATASFYSQRNLGGEFLGEVIYTFLIEEAVIVEPEPEPVEGLETSDVSFTLYNADDASVITELSHGQVLDNTFAELPVNINVQVDSPVGSVEITVNDNSSRIENGAPYFAFGDKRGDLSQNSEVLGSGTHRVTARFYADRNATGAFLGEFTRSFEFHDGVVQEPEPEPAHINLLLIAFNAESGQIITELSDNSQLTHDLHNVALNFSVQSDKPVGSFEIIVNDLPSRIENGAPYFAFGDGGGDIIGRGEVLGVGAHTITARAYEQRGLEGELLGETEVTFEIMQAPDDIPLEPQPIAIDANINAYRGDNGSIIGALSGGDVLLTEFDAIPLNFEIAPNQPIGSVQITVNDLPARVENGAPYFAFGDRRGDILGRGEALGIGKHYLVAQFYAERALGGDYLGEVTLSFEIGQDPNKASLEFFDADTGELLSSIQNGGSLSPGIFEKRKVAILLVPPLAINESEIGSVELSLGEISRLENAAPYALFGDRRGNLDGRGSEFGAGMYSLNFVLYSQRQAKGELLIQDTIEFHVQP